MKRRRFLRPTALAGTAYASSHAWMWLPRPYYAAQLAAGLGNISIVEGIPGTTKGIDTSACELRNGETVMQKTPGSGLRLT